MDEAEVYSLLSVTVLVTFFSQTVKFKMMAI